jgi:hypothetical protein
MAPVKGPVDLVAVVTAMDDALLAIVMVRGAVPTIVSVHPQFSAGAIIIRLLDDDFICA